MKLNPFVMMRKEFDGTGVVFNPDNHKVMALNKSGVVLWNALAAGATSAECADILMEEFSGVTPAQAEEDVRKFIGTLREKSLLSEN